MTGPAATPPSAAEPSPKPRLLVRLLAPLFVLAVSGVCALGVGELAVRMVKPQQLIILREDLWMPADTIGHRLRPNVSTTVNTGERTVHVYTDADGFRVGEAGRRDAPVRVLLIGDSFAEAIQVEYEQSYAHLLETGLAQATGRDVVVRNAGVSDWGPSNYLLRARQLTARDRYDLAVVTIFVGNDAVAQRRDYFPPRPPVAQHPLRLPRSLAWREFVDAVLAPVNDGLEKRSHLFVLLKNQFAGLRMKMGVTADYLPSEFRRAEATAPRWGVTAGIVKDLERELGAKGIPLVVVLIPERIQVYEDDFARYLAGFGIDPALVDLDQPSRLLGEAFGAESLLVRDLLADFRSAADSSARLFGQVDQHLSPDGHALLARLVVPTVAAQLTSRR